MFITLDSSFDLKTIKLDKAMKKRLFLSPYESPKSEAIHFEPLQMIMQSGGSNTEPIGGGDDPDIGWIGRPGDIWDLL